MPRSISVAVENSFIKGLITEATGLNQPENSCVETFDCIFDKTGKVSRRLGLDYESNNTLVTASAANSAIAEFLWKSVSKNGSISFQVVQLGATLHFFGISSSNTISNNKKSFTVNVNDFKILDAPSVVDVECAFATGNGLLFVAHPYCNPFFIEYDDETDTITTSEINIKVRDVRGLPNANTSGDILDSDYRPLFSEATPELSYNLLNQGWYTQYATTVGGTSLFLGRSTLDFWRQIRQLNSPPHVTNRDDLPSESDIWWFFKTPMVSPLDDINSLPKEAVSSYEIETSLERSTINSPAPKGHYILDAFNIDRSSISATDADTVKGAFNTLFSTTGIEVESSGYQRPSQIAFYAGRVFYGGTDSKGFNTKLYFTQIIDGSRYVDRCYQQEDPTKEDGADILSSDGGVIEIPDMASVIKLFVISDALYAFCTNGIWRISGSEGIGFTATDYSVVKIASIGALGARSFVDVEGVPIWWNTDGIWTIKQDGGRPSVISITDTSIKTFFLDIPNSSKRYAKGEYNPFTRIIHWLYRSTAETDISDRYKFDRILNLDVATGAFYPWTIPNTDLEISGISLLEGLFVNTNTTNVTVSGVNVTVSGVTVTVEETIRGLLSASKFKYLTVNNTTNKITFSEFLNDNLIDWETPSLNQEYTSYLISGYKVRGEGIRRFQNNYLQIFCDNTNLSTFDIYGRWDFANSANSGRWSQIQRVTMDDSNFRYGSRRLKMRGSGLALNFKITSVTQEPMNIVGWTALETINNLP